MTFEALAFKHLKCLSRIRAGLIDDVIVKSTMADSHHDDERAS